MKANNQTLGSLGMHNHLGTQPDCRLEVTLPKMNFYNVDNVLHVIAAASEPFACGKFCSQCDISSAHESKRIDIYQYACEGLSSRHQVLRALCLQLKKLIDLGRFQIWNSAMRKAPEFPWSSEIRNVRYNDLMYWVRNSFIFHDDLLLFLSSEKIRANFVIYARDPSGKITADSFGDEEKQDELTPTVDNELEKNCEKSPPKLTPAEHLGNPEIPRKRPQRFDYLAVEIDEILTSDPEMTPAHVWRALTVKIGESNTCIVNAIDAGLRWKNVKGNLVLASPSNVADRVARWKKANK
ncbi:hypothetical protein [Undibacterium sp.]|uniref:hypothetical protein n=1 Tax=Undibacterium sp. TaxID=1914977 RepID=UPI0025FC6649|nr:hypothetical protein [Undibacterium sp.]